jgi:hypothetical protein
MIDVLMGYIPLVFFASAFLIIFSGVVYLVIDFIKSYTLVDILIMAIMFPFISGFMFWLNFHAL